MRHRQQSRLCGACGAPLARQEDACWSCGVRWGIEEQPRTTLRVIPGGRGTTEPTPAEIHAAVAAVAVRP